MTETGAAPNLTTRTGGEALVDALLANGVDTVFGLPGAQMYPFFDALARSADRIRTLGARHEQACGYMAFGYARSSGRPGVFSVVPGPGVLNTTAALVTALGCSTPVLCITGEVPSAFLGRGRGHLHELPDQLATLRTLTKWSARIDRVEDTPAVMEEAFRQMLSGRPGPVAVMMPWDTMGSAAPVASHEAARLPAAPTPHPDAIRAAAGLIARARRPIIMTGGGAQHAAAEVQALSDRLGAPVAAFRGGRGVVADDAALGISSYAAFKLWPEVDLVIAIGTRLEMPTMRWTGMMRLVDRLETPMIRIDIDPVEMTRLVADVGVVADAQDATRALLDAVGGSARPDPAWAAAVDRVKAEAARDIAVVQPQLAYLDVIRAALPDDGILVGELTQVGFAAYFGYPVRQPRTFLSEGYQGTLGYGFPSALGAKRAHPDRAVVSIAGDGGFLFAVQELATAVQEGLGVVVVLFNNGAYGNVARDQQTRFGGRLIGATLSNPDFQVLAAAFGVDFHRVGTAQALAPVLAGAIRQDRPCVIEVVVPPGSEVSPWPFIHCQR